MLKASRGVGIGEGVSPFPANWDLGERHELSQLSLGQNSESGADVFLELFVCGRTP